MGDLDLVRYEEGWQDDRHDARKQLKASTHVDALTKGRQRANAEDPERLVFSVRSGGGI
jgi:hypothetical protein